MPKRRVRMTFPPDLIQQPIIYEIGKRFAVVTNIRRADVEETHGWVVLELEGDEGEIDRAISWAKELGVRIDPVTGDIVAG